MKQQQLQHPSLNSKAFTFCFCCHVRTGTLLYGIASVLIHLMLLGLLVLAAIHPDVLMPKDEPTDDGIIVGQQTENHEDLFNTMGDGVPKTTKITKDNLCVAFGMTLAWVVSVVALIYGVAKSRASYLMPCFCLMVFDFCLTCLMVVSLFTSAPDMHSQMKQWKLEHLAPKTMHNVDRDVMMLLLVAALMFVLSFKAYLMGMVWSCYRYIQIYVESRNMVREYSVDPDTEVCVRVGESMLLPPRYEDAIKVPSHMGLPPAYTAPQ